MDPHNDAPEPRGTRLDINIGTSMMVNRQDSEKGLKCSFVGLDQDFRARLRTVIERLTQGNVRVIVVETDRDEIPPGITHVLSVDDCRVVDQKPVSFPGTRDTAPRRESPTTREFPETERKRVSQSRLISCTSSRSWL